MKIDDVPKASAAGGLAGGAFLFFDRHAYTPSFHGSQAMPGYLLARGHWRCELFSS
jgi:hypothetical protein